MTSHHVCSKKEKENQIHLGITKKEECSDAKMVFMFR